uniref:DNA (Cytosine-5-)-methyltransferase 2 n=1 Tax=Gnatocerus cornutus TaxID=1553328 RepID=A0A1L7N292_9CUCU|nr:DNA (cytosine-5-)-methyltransferase 2 [Gnatocerus cornutus]
MKVLELFSGIGGMHFALKCSGVEGEIKASIDINPIANSVYKHNFPDVLLLNRNIQSLTPKFINSLDVDTILMSPPCQPFTRNGLQKDVLDDRTKSFLHILEILPELNVRNILVENVKGFEGSQMRELFVESLEKCGFVWQEFILSPNQIGVPNSRHRYYCVAKKGPEKFSFEVGALKTELPSWSQEICYPISDILNSSENLEPYYLEDKILRKYAKILDICHSNSKNSCCFTKAYGRYLEGTGSVFTEVSENVVKAIFEKLSVCKPDAPEYLELARKLKLRFFTPWEISRLMSFPESFSFPESLTDRQKYMLLGNSINVKVVAELIKILQ